MATYTENVLRYKAFDPTGTMLVGQIAQSLGWSSETSNIIKYYVSDLSEDELSVLDNVTGNLDADIVKAICLLPPESRTFILPHIDRIISAAFPLAEMDQCLEEAKGEDPLKTIRSGYWRCVAGYLRQRDIDQSPFTKKATNFIFSIGYNGYINLSKKQKDWIRDLLDKDRERPENDRFFVNEHILLEGYADACSIIQKLMK
ncbi:MAG: hypothetical protein ABI581_13335 [Sediminibacterium sp.]